MSNHLERALRYVNGNPDRQAGQPKGTGRRTATGYGARPPRGVPKEEYAARNIYDVWFPNLSPSEALLKKALTADDEKSWRAFKRRFQAEMKTPEAMRDLDLLAALSHRTNLAIGCYCEDEARCHRSILRDLLVQRGADIK